MVSSRSEVPWKTASPTAATAPWHPQIGSPQRKPGPATPNLTTLRGTPERPQFLSTRLLDRSPAGGRSAPSSDRQPDESVGDQDELPAAPSFSAGAGPPAGVQPVRIREGSVDPVDSLAWDTAHKDGLHPKSSGSRESRESRESPRSQDRGLGDAKSQVRLESRPHKDGVSKRCTSRDPFWVQAEAQPKPAVSPLSCGSTYGAPLKCLGEVADLVDTDFEIEVPEAELTTVHIQSWEQRLDWRSFLSEAVASSMARQAFQNFDVEAEPPSYARPPPSMLSSANARSNAQQVGTMPRCVAPTGAGWAKGKMLERSLDRSEEGTNVSRPSSSSQPSTPSVQSPVR